MPRKTSNPYRLKVETHNGDPRATLILLRDNRKVGYRVFDPRELPEAISARIHAFGMSAILQTRTSAEDAVGKLEAMDGVFELLKSGTWEKERQVGAPVVSSFVEAVSRVMGISIPEAQRSLRKYDDAQKANMRENEKIREQMVIIERERANAAEDSAELDDLLS